VQYGVNKYQNLLKFRYHAIGFIALINSIFFLNYAIRENLYTYAFQINRLGYQRVDTPLILTCSVISVTIFVFSWISAKQYPWASSDWRGNELPLKIIIAAGIVVFVFALIGSPTKYLDVHLHLGQSSVGNKLLGIVYFILGNICIMAIIKGNIRRILLICAPFVVVYSGRAMLWAPVVFVTLLAGAFARTGNYNWETLMLQTNLLVWAPAYQIDVYASQVDLTDFVSKSYIANGGGVGSFIALNFEKYFPFANGLLMTSLFPAILSLFSKGPISNAVIIALALFYPIAVRNNFESYMPILILFVLGSTSVFFRLRKKKISAEPT
jgi:hypothetical protein